jgi:nucleotide-binding universal stress UspA family protein
MADEKIIVCATDLSEDSRHALDTAIELAAARGAKLLHVIHVRETTERFETVDEVATRADEQERALIEQVKQEVEHVRASRGRAVGVGIAIDVRYGNAYREILRYAADTKADTLMVGRACVTRCWAPWPSASPVTRPATSSSPRRPTCGRTSCVTSSGRSVEGARTWCDTGGP